MHDATFGDWLKMERKARRLSQYKLADATGVDRSHIAKMETGNIALPSEETRARFHRFFGTSDDDLVLAGILQRFERPNGETFYLAAGEPGPRMVVALPDAETVSIRRDDPRLAVLALFDGMPDDAVRRWLEAFRTFMYLTGHSAPETNMAESEPKHTQTETA